MELESGERGVVERALSSILERLDTGDAAGDSSSLCRSLTAALTNHPELADKVAEVLAALGREESFREAASTHSLLPQLTPLLGSSSTAAQLQSLRAIGNLCFDHDANREQVLASGGCPLLVDLLTQCSSLPAHQDNVRLKTVACGCMLNVANQNEKLCKEFLRLDAVRHLSMLLAHPGEEEMTMKMGLQALSVLVDSESADLEALLDTPLAATLTHVLQLCNDGELELTENVLEIVGTLVENDKWKLSHVNGGLVHQLLAVQDESMQQKAMDTIILLLSEDMCLQKMFEEGKVLTQAMEWMKSGGSPLTRKATAALIVANMARSESMCTALVGQGVVPLLMELTRLEEPEEMAGKLCHAALSALRNLSIPVANKQLFLQEGVVDTALDALKQSTYAHVQFKALSILRLLVDKQADVCIHIISRQPGSVSRVNEVCMSASVIPHIQIEAGRLLAAIIKHCNDTGVMRTVVGEDGVRWMVSLLDSEHQLLRNEGLVALNLLAALQEEAVTTALMDSELLSQLSKLLSSSDSPPEVLTNALVLLDSLASSQSDHLKAKLEASPEFGSGLNVLCDHSNEMLKTKARELHQKLELEPR